MTTATFRPLGVFHIRALRVLWRMLVPIAVAANVVLWPKLLGASEAIQHQAFVAAIYILVATGIVALATEILSPQRPELRLVPLTDRRADRMATVVRWVCLVLLCTELARYFVRANAWSEAADRLLELLRNMGLLVFLLVLIRHTKLLKWLDGAPRETYTGSLKRHTARVGFPLLVVGSVFALVAYALGYAPHARWVGIRLLWTFVLIALAGVVYRFLQRRVHNTVTFFRDTGDDGGVASMSAGEPSPASVGAERLGSGFTRIVVIVATAVALLALWGLGRDRLQELLARPLWGSDTRTVGDLLWGLLWVALVFIASAVIRTLLIFFVFPRSRVDVGVRYAIVTILRYATWVLAAMMLARALGIDASAMTVFAGAFGVGLAFGLQDIFANFFSGLIMLIERPVRVGDVVHVGGISGTVEAIRLRGTLLRAADRSTVLIPNRQMIGERLTNKSFGVERTRLQIEVPVSASARAEVVQRVLERTLRNDERLLHEAPFAPHVRLTGLADSTLHFVCRAFTERLGEKAVIASELHAAIHRALDEAGIPEMATVHEVTVRGGESPSA